MSTTSHDHPTPFRLGSKHKRNPGVAYDTIPFKEVILNKAAITKSALEYARRRPVKKAQQAAWLLRVISCCDITTLESDDTESKVERLCWKARFPVRRDLLEQLHIMDAESKEPLNPLDAPITTGAVCVYPARVAEAAKFLEGTGIPIAAVATGFPSGQIRQDHKIEEIKRAVADGANEIDIVIPRDLALQGKWEELYQVIKAFRAACGEAHMKTILATGELESMTNIYRASMVCMMAGADFIKTSTGKEKENAVMPVGLVMIRAIRDYREASGHIVGFKPAGGISTAKVALDWMAMMKEELGEEYTRPDLFRYGCSSLVPDIERQLHHCVYGEYASFTGIAP